MFYINDAVETDKRFDSIKFFDIDEDNIDILNSFFMTNIPLLSEQGTKIVTNQEKRPDLLSYDIYRDTQYWWILLIYNNILSINELITGLEIHYPSLSSIEYLYERASLLKKSA